MPSNNIEIGETGERIASSYIRRSGYRIIVKNFKTRIGEIDIIACKQRTLIFIEVKCRRSKRFGAPFESVTREKTKKIRKIAQQYISLNQQELKNYKELKCRFDVISIMLGADDKVCELIHMEDAF